jgi:hypothetical protein
MPHASDAYPIIDVLNLVQLPPFPATSPSQTSAAEVQDLQAPHPQSYALYHSI